MYGDQLQSFISGSSPTLSCHIFFPTPLPSQSCLFLTARPHYCRSLLPCKRPISCCLMLERWILVIKSDMVTAVLVTLWETVDQIDASMRVCIALLAHICCIILQEAQLSLTNRATHCAIGVSDPLEHALPKALTCRNVCVGVSRESRRAAARPLRLSKGSTTPPPPRKTPSHMGYRVQFNGTSVAYVWRSAGKWVLGVPPFKVIVNDLGQ